MLDSLRRGASGWLAKILFFFLILAFAVWGIPTSFNFSPAYVAKVGKTEISVEEFQNTFQNQINMMAQFGQRLTPEQARASGLHVRALIGLIDTAAVDEHARSLDLAVSPETTALQIAREPSFRGPDGKFDRQAFDGYLRQIRMSEQGFLATRGKDEVREQITGTLQAAAAVPPAMVDTFYAWGEAQRKVVYFTLPETAAKITEPDEAKLKETWEQTKRQFVVPERRKLGVLLLSLDKLKAETKVPDADIKAYYDANRDSLDIPDRRRVQQVRFKTREEAESARKAIEGGKSFLMVALEAEGAGGQMPELLAKSDFGDLSLSQTIFELPLNKVSEVMASGTGAALFMVSEIVPGKKRTLEETREEIRDKLAADKVNDALKSQARFGRQPSRGTSAAEADRLGAEAHLRRGDDDARQQDGRRQDRLRAEGRHREVDRQRFCRQPGRGRRTRRSCRRGPGLGGSAVGDAGEGKALRGGQGPGQGDRAGHRAPRRAVRSRQDADGSRRQGRDDGDAGQGGRRQTGDDGRLQAL